MYRTVISQNYSDPAHKMIDNNRWKRDTWQIIKSSLSGIFVCFYWKMYKNIEKYIKNW